MTDEKKNKPHWYKAAEWFLLGLGLAVVALAVASALTGCVDVPTADGGHDTTILGVIPWSHTDPEGSTFLTPLTGSEPVWLIALKTLFAYKAATTLGTERGRKNAAAVVNGKGVRLKALKAIALDSASPTAPPA